MALFFLCSGMQTGHGYFSRWDPKPTTVRTVYSPYDIYTHLSTMFS